MQSTRYSFRIIKKTLFSRQIFEKYSNVKFHQNSSIGSPAVIYGPMDGLTNIPDESHSRFSQFDKRT